MEEQTPALPDEAEFGIPVPEDIRLTLQADADRVAAVLQKSEQGIPEELASDALQFFTNLRLSKKARDDAFKPVGSKLKRLTQRLTAQKKSIVPKAEDLLARLGKALGLASVQWGEEAAEEEAQLREKTGDPLISVASKMPKVSGVRFKAGDFTCQVFDSARFFGGIASGALDQSLVTINESAMADRLSQLGPREMENWGVHCDHGDVTAVGAAGANRTDAPT
jgi:hypothetical protein